MRIATPGSDHLRVCRACHSSYRVRRRLGYGLFCLVIAAIALVAGAAARAHPLGLLLLLAGLVTGFIGARALRPSPTCSICRSDDTAPMGPDGKALSTG